MGVFRVLPEQEPARADDQDHFTVGERKVLRGAVVGRALSQALHASPEFRSSSLRVAAETDLAARRTVAMAEASTYAASNSRGRHLFAWLMEAAAGAPGWDAALWQMVLLWSRPAPTTSVDGRAGYKFDNRRRDDWQAGAAWLASRGAGVCVHEGCSAPTSLVTRQAVSVRRQDFARAVASLYCADHEELHEYVKSHTRQRAKRTLQAAVEAWPTPAEHLAVLRIVASSETPQRDPDVTPPRERATSGSA